MLKNPRGFSLGSFFAAIVTIIFTVIAGPIVGAGVACVTGLICGHGGGGGGGGSARPPDAVYQSCTSAPNACNMTNIGTLQAAGACSATPPPNSSCPAPVIAQPTGFYATPSTVSSGGSVTLTWSAANATDCTIKSDTGFSGGGGSSGSASTGPLSQTTTFTLTCSNGADGPQTSASMRVIVSPHYREL